MADIPDIYNPLWTFFFIFFLIFNIFLWAHHHSFQKGGITKTKPQPPVPIVDLKTEGIARNRTELPGGWGTNVADDPTTPMTATTSL